MGDQLTLSLTSLQAINKTTDLVFMCEVITEATHIKHHKKKLVLIFSAMRHFAAELTKLGYQVKYVKLTDPENTGSFVSELTRLKNQQKITEIVATKPSEYHVLQALKTIPITWHEDNRFICNLAEFFAWAKPKTNLRMEYFYRNLRRQHKILMQDKQPEQGQWNFDQANRKKLPKSCIVPAPTQIAPDAITKTVIKMVQAKFPDHFGAIKPFTFAVTRSDALIVLSEFIAQRLSNFGSYQDAMQTGSPWLFHAHISFYLNIGLLLPLECIKAAEAAYYGGLAPINAVEGFIRQILGWREYVRGIYWLKMPEYKNLNFLQAERELPEFYWTAKTKLNCLKQVITETKENAYAHHIQRLMVLGNFALLYGVKPAALNEWFWLVYADAFEWVELPNVSGMVLFADGGYLASKPYAAGGSYINKMSNYCSSCAFNVKEKTGAKACPFNYLYWDFLQRNASKLRGNQRLAMMYSLYDKMSPSQKSAIANSAAEFYAKI